MARAEVSVGVLSAPASRMATRSYRALVQPVVLLVFSAVLYGFWGTGGTWKLDVPPTRLDLLAEAFLAAQLYLKIEPGPELLALPDPYDPTHNQLHRMHDASLYQGKFYLYWGPVSAFPNLVWRALTGRAPSAALIGVVAAVVVAVTFWLILDRCREMMGIAGSGWFVFGSALAFAAGGPMLYLVGRPDVYHQPLLIGMSLLMLSWYALLRGYDSPRRRAWWLLASGTLLGLAIGSRIVYLGYIVGPGVVMLWAYLRARRSANAMRFLDLASFGAPLAVTGVALALYNVARFGSPFEFGISYVLQGSPEFYYAVQVSGHKMTSLANMPTHVLIYLGALPRIELSYSFLGPHAFFTSLRDASTSSLAFPWFDDATPSFGELPLMSGLLLAPAGLFALGAPLWLLTRGGPGKEHPRMFMASMTVGVCATVALLGCFSGITVRYTADFVPALSIVGALVVLRYAALWSGRRTEAGQVGTSAGERRVLAGTVAASWVTAIVFGVLLGLHAWQFSFPQRAVELGELAPSVGVQGGPGSGR